MVRHCTVLYQFAQPSLTCETILVQLASSNIFFWYLSCEVILRRYEPVSGSPDPPASLKSLECVFSVSKKECWNLRRATIDRIMFFKTTARIEFQDKSRNRNKKDTMRQKDLGWAAKEYVNLRMSSVVFVTPHHHHQHANALSTYWCATATVQRILDWRCDFQDVPSHSLDCRVKVLYGR